MENDLIEIRAHHLVPIGKIRNLTLEELGNLLMISGYVIYNLDPFVSRLYESSIDMLNKADHLKVRLIAGNPDFICDACPKKRYCNLLHCERADERSIKGIELNKVYTLRDLLEKSENSIRRAEKSDIRRLDSHGFSHK